ncbi:MAG: GNAT family N-acetyltransferase [Candidatus Eisenbacteria bacterium]|uniref:GNAT family N-acetyltransferase n=1 Tax=Eiseniibacteriota bacterium TaxID=2212470 RepID=A0A538TLG8_UNCEI|nr:MAG: GNAT family N-acetyltransferase [Candidatus Eisenbacteria bacterium]
MERMNTSRLETQRLTLVAATLPMLRAELARPEEFARLLGAEVAAPWPPPLNDEQSNRWMIRLLEEDPEIGNWGMWYFLLREGPTGGPLAIGNGGYKGKPSADGTVEIGYSVVEAYQRKGLATEGARGLIDRALRDPAVTRVIAETFPDLTPSIRVLEKNGFLRIEESGSEPGVIRFELKRP